ncbi:hypothetical protein EUGRSUZ_I00817 [Eucalyptus grandis]|uniref:Uncharacterized protein n=2 Tax=Eucalyptus grandis TaxID=71139 RepID=A0ACC3JCS4_EUCGR|nr:hypothetical protein EUGRSUZ_I00817 [Eucalyptus grandis]
MLVLLQAWPINQPRPLQIVPSAGSAYDEEILGAIKVIFPAGDDDASVVAKAQAVVSLHQKEAELLSPIAEVPKERTSLNAQKRKSIIKL